MKNSEDNSSEFFVLSKRFKLFRPESKSGMLIITSRKNINCSHSGIRTHMFLTERNFQRVVHEPIMRYGSI